MNAFRRWWAARQRTLDHDALAGGDPWVRLPYAPPLPAFGPGARHEFGHYLEGTSRVHAATPLDVADWLRACRYAEDPQLLGEHDEWQHPCTFELVRSGDCEDYALWAWRKLVEARYHAEFVVGMHHRSDGYVGRHAWVVVREGVEEFVLDGVQRTVESILRRRSVVTTEYVPQVGAAPSGQRFIFAGLFRTDWGRRVKCERLP